jgi:copper chaperone CopZ
MKRFVYCCFIFALMAACKHGASTEKSVNAPDAALTSIEIEVKGMTCTSSEESIVKGITSLEGVQEARASYTEGKDWVTYDSIRVSVPQLAEAIKKKGYEVTGNHLIETDR